MVSSSCRVDILVVLLHESLAVNVFLLFDQFRLLSFDALVKHFLGLLYVLINVCLLVKLADLLQEPHEHNQANHAGDTVPAEASSVNLMFSHLIISI